MAAAQAVQKDSLVDRLKADHLADEIAEATKAPVQKITNLDDPKAKNPYTFQFRWTDGRGKVWEGEFTNKILSIGERQAAGAMRARFALSAPERLDMLTNELNLMVAHLHYSLQTKPDWAEDLQALTDVGLLQAIYLEVASHEATFHGLGPIAGGSEA